MPSELKSSSATVAEEIRAEMARQKISVNALAECIGMPISTLRRSINGSRPFGVDEVFKVTQALNVSATSIIQRAEKLAS